MSAANKHRADVLLITVNKIETSAVRTAFRAAVGHDPVPVEIDKRVYWKLGTVKGAEVYHAFSEMGSTGPGGSQQAVDRAIRALSPAAVFAVGVAFGVDEKEQKIGDILFSTQLQLYEPQRVGKKIILRGDKPHASTWLINLLTGTARFGWAGAAVRSGLVLTGEKLVDNPELRAKLIKLVPEAIGGEMEGGGLYVSSHDHKVDWIVVKAICDWGMNKGTRKKQRQEIAAKNAAEFVLQALQQVFVGHDRDLAVAVPQVAADAVPADRAQDVGGADHERLRAAFTVLAGCFQKHRAMMDQFRYAILNKLSLRDRDAFEEERAELDKRVFPVLPQLVGAVPPPLERLVRRLRGILSCSWGDPLGIYYELLESGKCFPRAPVDAAGRLYNDVLEAYSEMTYLFFRGTTDLAPYQEGLRKHHLDEQAKSMRDGVEFRVARAVILEPELTASDVRANVLQEYAGWTQRELSR